jgi:hypothetical protein
MAWMAAVAAVAATRPLLRRPSSAEWRAYEHSVVSRSQQSRCSQSQKGPPQQRLAWCAALTGAIEERFRFLLDPPSSIGTALRCTIRDAYSAPHAGQGPCMQQGPCYNPAEQSEWRTSNFAIASFAESKLLSGSHVSSCGP